MTEQQKNTMDAIQQHGMPYTKMNTQKKNKDYTMQSS